MFNHPSERRPEVLNKPPQTTSRESAEVPFVIYGLSSAQVARVLEGDDVSVLKELLAHNNRIDYIEEIQGRVWLAVTQLSEQATRHFNTPGSENAAAASKCFQHCAQLASFSSKIARLLERAAEKRLQKP